MGFDIAFVVLLALFAIVGLFQGVVNQIFRLVGLFGVWIYIRYFCDHVAGSIAERSKLTDLNAYLAGFIAGALLIYLIFVIIGWVVTWLTRPKEEPVQRTHNFLGPLLGVIRGVLVVGFLFCIVAIMPARALRDMPAVRADMSRSFVLATVEGVNPLRDFRFVLNFAAYAEVLKDEKAQHAIQTQPPLIELGNNNDVRDAVNDPEVQKLIHDRKLLRLLALPKVRKLMADPEVLRLLNQIDPEAALREAHATEPATPTPSKPSTPARSPSE